MYLFYLLVATFFGAWVLVVVLGVASNLRLRASGYKPRRQVALTGPCHAFDSATSRSMRGGVRLTRWKAATWPLARMTADRECVELTAPNGTLCIPRAEAETLLIVRGPIAAGVILFRTTSGKYDGVRFGTFSVDEVGATLAALGWPVQYR